VARIYEEIDARLAAWIAEQPLFFVGTAPLSPDGHVNVSPKGPIETLRVLGPRDVAYLDYAGSGSETIAHARENGRIVLMLCAFQGPPRILRLHGRATVVPATDPGFDALARELGLPEPEVPESRRAIVRIAVDRIADSCGYGVPLMALEGERQHYPLHAQKRLRTLGSDGYREHVASRNAHSIDGLPALAD
jgi:Pyridoxamine 5'-phosphate oxidase